MKIENKLFSIIENTISNYDIIDCNLPQKLDHLKL